MASFKQAFGPSRKHYYNRLGYGKASVSGCIPQKY